MLWSFNLEALEMGQISYRCGAGQPRPILGEGRWFRASIVEE